MQLSFVITLPLISTLLILTTVQGSADANNCSTFGPTSAYQIYSSHPDLSTDLTIQTNGTANSTRLSSRSNEKRHSSKSRRAAHIPFTFSVSQDAGNTNNQDLVVAFAGLPCYGPSPFSFEFFTSNPSPPTSSRDRARSACSASTRWTWETLRRGILSSR